MEFIMELIGEFFVSIIFEGSIEVLKSKKAPWIVKTICMFIWMAVFIFLFLIGISITKHTNPVIGYMSIAFTIFLAGIFIYHIIK